MYKKLTMWWFLWGLGSQLQIFASLSITELAVLLIAPFTFVKDLRYMKRDGILKFVILAFLVVLGCAIACAYNHTPFYYSLRGYAATTIILATIPTAHLMLRSDPDGFKWSVLGAAFSNFLSTFIFQKAVEMGGVAEVSYADIMSGPLYWISRLASFMYVLPVGWYLQTPLIYCVFAPVFMSFFSMYVTASGRSAALGAIGTAIFCFIGGKTQKSISRICRNFWLLLFMGTLGVLTLNAAYRYAATHGLLGSDALNKYERQTRTGTNVLALLMGGRGEFFVGLMACLDDPIIGKGPWARDEKGYYDEYLIKYGAPEDYETYRRTNLDYVRMGYGYRRRLIPAHSHIVSSWLWNGITGLVFWIYVIFVLLRYLKQDCAAIPQWFYWLACMIPSMLWNIFFSPMPNRTSIPLSVVACLIARLVRQGRYRLPIEMESKISYSSK